MSITSLNRPIVPSGQPGESPEQVRREQLQAASEQFEAMFLQQILKQMRKAGDVLSAGSPLRSRDLDTMRDFYDEALAEHLASRKQTGIADLLVRQLSAEPTDTAEPVALADGGEALRRPSVSSRNPLVDSWQRGVDRLAHAWQQGTAGFRTLVDSVIGQESGGNAAAVSPKGARGLMQLMPDTAREVAGELGLPYDEQRLTSDPAYNKALGSAYLGKMLDRYDGQHVLALAAYNAGPGKVDEWLKNNGDPRSGQIGMADWVRSIPYDETRDYTLGVLRRVREAQAPARIPGSGLSPEAGLKHAPQEGFKRHADSVAYQGQQPEFVSRPASAAFAQPIRLESKENAS